MALETSHVGLNWSLLTAMGRSVIGMPVSTCERRHVVETPLRVSCGKHTETYGESWKIMENHHS